MSGGPSPRRKGDGIERELVELHRALGIHAERYPLSGASRFRGSGHDLDLYVHGRDEAPLVVEVKARKNGGGFAQLEKWLGDYDALFLRRDRADALVLLPWRVWADLIRRTKQLMNFLRSCAAIGTRSFNSGIWRNAGKSQRTVHWETYNGR